MDLTGEYRIPAPRDTVWRALNDPDILRQCIPGCEELDKTSETEFTAKVRLKIGPVAARFSGRVTLSDIEPPAGYRISGEGQGGAAGFGKGGALVRLTEAGDAETVLAYQAEAQVGGKLAQLGSRLIQGTAAKLADDFFAKFSAVVADGPGAGAPAEGEAPSAATSDDEVDAAATELLVEAAEELEARPEVPSSAMPDFASVPLAAHPERVAVDPDDAPAIAALAEPHHRLEEASDGAEAEAGGRSAGLRPLVWIPLVVLTLMLMLALFL